MGPLRSDGGMSSMEGRRASCSPHGAKIRDSPLGKEEENTTGDMSWVEGGGVKSTREGETRRPTRKSGQGNERHWRKQSQLGPLRRTTDWETTDACADAMTKTWYWIAVARMKSGKPS